MSQTTGHEAHGPHQSKLAAMSGWIGSALEYYDFFIYAQAAALIFPQIFFPRGDAKVAIAASLATYGIGYVARPIGAIVLGHWGDTHGRKSVLLVCMFLMGFSTMAVAFLPTYEQVGFWAPAMLVVLRLIQGFAVAGEISGASSMILEHAPFGRRGYFGSFGMQGVTAGQLLAAAVFLPLSHFMSDAAFNAWGWRVPFLMSAFVLVAGYFIRRKVRETPAFAQADESGGPARSPVKLAFTHCWDDMLRVMCMSIMNVIPVVATIFGGAYAVQQAYGIGFSKSWYLWIPVLGNVTAMLVIPLWGALSDRVGRRLPIIVASLGSGLLSFAYLYAISLHNVTLAIILSILMWGIVYQGQNAVYPSFYPELFPIRMRVSSMAIAQNVGVAISALLPALFTAVAPPGSTHIWLTVGGITFGITVLASIATYSARETYRIHMSDLGKRDAIPVGKHEYERLRNEAMRERSLREETLEGQGIAHKENTA
ncbi:major facilitator transporter [Caballeronia cordobensis]|uniref:Major facilitator transporter n=1 Tax=Caballeronia cordobensis TaxID=1353886 RepID=A0A158HPB3_CABCO|nr:MFS transporter [Caballeronia cordobensis]SAL45913.1 major facilitator transporter [Caballeronia cordobensis]